MTKQEMFEKGLEHIEAFCKLNGLFGLSVTTYTRAEWRFGRTCAYYRQNSIHISLGWCAAIGRGGPSWSYPGYTVDRTPFGVLAHETGHHMDFTHSGVKALYGGDLSSNMRKLSGEERLTSYCPNDFEWFAEMARLFITNPNLLKAIRPRTYDLFLYAGFEPLETRSWQEVLEDAPQRTIDMAYKKAQANDCA